MLKAFLVFVGTGCIAAALAVNPWTVSPLLGVSGLPAAFRGDRGRRSGRRRSRSVLDPAAGQPGSRRRRRARLADHGDLPDRGRRLLRLVRIQPGVLSLFLPPADSAHIYRLKPDLDLETGSRAYDLDPDQLHGMRWREAPTEKPAGSTRIAFVGDSFTFGQWASTAERSLVGVFDAEMRPLEVDVLNFGVPGYGFLEIEERLETDVSAFHLDYVALVSFNGNDFMDTYVGFSRYDPPERDPAHQRRQHRRKIPAPFYRQAAAVTSPCSSGSICSTSFRPCSKAWSRAGPPDAGFPPRRPPFEAATVSNIFWSRREYPPFAEAARDVSIEAWRSRRSPRRTAPS